VRAELAQSWRAGTATVGGVERALILKTFPGFIRLNAAELGVMAAMTTEKFFPAGTEMHTPGAPVARFHLIVEGKAAVYRHGQVSQELGSRSSLGGLAALTGDPKGIHAVAVEDTLALEFDVDDMRDVFEDNFGILLGVMAAMARTLRELQQMTLGAAVASNKTMPPIEIERPLTVVEKMLFLKRTTNFGDASIEALYELANQTPEVRWKAGDRIWTVGEPTDWSFGLFRGEVECRPPGKPSFGFGPGFVVGGIDSLAGEPRWYECWAVTDARAIRFARSALFDVFEDHPEVGMVLLRNLAGGVNAMLEAMAARKKAQSERPPPPASD
jgi:CRP-like cAMP-binding protein